MATIQCKELVNNKAQMGVLMPGPVVKAFPCPCCLAAVSSGMWLTPVNQSHTSTGHNCRRNIKIITTYTQASSLVLVDLSCQSCSGQEVF